VLHAFSPSTQEAEAGGSLSLRPAWPTERVSGQPRFLDRETLFHRNKIKWSSVLFLSQHSEKCYLYFSEATIVPWAEATWPNGSTLRFWVTTWRTDVRESSHLAHSGICSITEHKTKLSFLFFPPTLFLLCMWVRYMCACIHAYMGYTYVLGMCVCVCVWSIFHFMFWNKISQPGLSV